MVQETKLHFKNMGCILWGQVLSNKKRTSRDVGTLRRGWAGWKSEKVAPAADRLWHIITSRAHGGANKTAFISGSVPFPADPAAMALLRSQWSLISLLNCWWSLKQASTKLFHKSHKIIILIVTGTTQCSGLRRHLGARPFSPHTRPSSPRLPKSHNFRRKGLKIYSSHFLIMT